LKKHKLRALERRNTRNTRGSDDFPAQGYIYRTRHLEGPKVTL